ncbi:MAG: hypothetical protein KAX44_00275 [Candidatus Brocadiae bacterium]|nr:hypothetical protein [Candidatus Brocadiia bacterium]
MKRNVTKVAQVAVSVAIALLVSASPANADDADKGLVLHYPFHGHMKDVSGSNNHGASPESSHPALTKDRFGESDCAYLFDGKDDYIQLDNPVSGFPFSINAWVMTSNTGEGGVVSLAYTGSNGRYYLMGIREGKACLVANNAASSRLDSGTSIADGQWHMLTAVFVSDTNRRLYVDGVPAASSTEPVSYYGSANKMSIGRLERHSPSDYFNGSIDDVRIYDRQLTDEEVQALSNARFVPDTTAPAPISNLRSPARGTTWLYLEWDNPGDPDYGDARVYVDGRHVADVLNNHYSWKLRDGTTVTVPSLTLLDLAPGTEYAITVHTRDYSNNVNEKDVGLAVSTRPVPDRTPVCGNNVKEEGEICDGYDLGGHAPPTLGMGFTGGTLKSKPDCSGFDTSECVIGKEINAASSEYADVLAALQGARTGDIVVVPEGTSTWTDVLVIDKGVTLKGAGVGKTVITAIQENELKEYAAIRIAPPQDVYVRVTGFTFKGYPQEGLSGRGIVVSPPTRLTQLRIDHNRFMDFSTRGSRRGSSRAIYNSGWIHSVVDHNEFIDCLKSVDCYGDGGRGWARPIALGTANRVFIEDNTFTFTDARMSGGITSGGQGARYTFRHNKVIAPFPEGGCDPMDAHGNQRPVEGQDALGTADFAPGQGHHRGTVSVEIYNNTFWCEKSNRFMSIRGGTGVIFGNVMTCGRRAAGTHMWEEESYRFAGWGHHYPAWDQINAYHVWGNTLNGEPVGVSVNSAGDRYFIREGRDYFTRPPDRQGDLHYGYKPFTYPHPMTQMEAHAGR